MFFPNPAILAAGAGVAPVGQQLFTASGTFIVPEGVTSICAVAIGYGGPADLASWGEWFGGAGGGLAYSNDIAVTPGESLSVLISFSGTAQSYLARGGVNIVRATAGRFDTNTDRPVPGTGTHGQVLRTGGGSGYALGAMKATGGGAAGYTSDGEGGGEIGVSGRSGRGTSPYGGGPGGAAGTAPTTLAATYGGGGGEDVGRGPGCVRIIWGADRAFPNTNTGDITE